MSDKTGTAQIGVVGMAVMGSNLARNFASKGFKTAVFNRTYAKTEAVVAAHPEAGFIASETVEEFVDSLEKPRRILIMVKAGGPEMRSDPRSGPYFDPVIRARSGRPNRIRAAFSARSARRISRPRSRL